MTSRCRRLPAVRSDRCGREPLLVRHPGGEAVEQRTKWWRRDGRRLLPPSEIAQPLLRPVPKVACRERRIRTVMAPHLMRGPTPRGGLDDRGTEEVRASETETRGDHDQLA